VGDTNTAKTDSLKVLDPKRPIREADIASIDHLVGANQQSFRDQLPPEPPKLFGLAIGEVLQLFTPEECLSYLANAGYGRT
jgi:hypothetical protein